MGLKKKHLFLFYQKIHLELVLKYFFESDSNYETCV